MIDPALLTCAERLQYEGHIRRQESNEAIRALAAVGAPIKEITRQTGRSRKLVRSVLRGTDGDVFRVRRSALEPYLAELDAAWAAGCRNGAKLWRRLRATRRACEQRRISRHRRCDPKRFGDVNGPWYYCASQPPSITSSDPVTNDASSDAR